MKEHQTQFSLQKMSHTYDVSRSGYYAWLNRQPSQRDLDNQTLIKHILKAHRDSYGIYGSPRITEVLHRQGISVSENRIARLMQREGIIGRIHTKKKRAPSIVDVIKRTNNKRLIAREPTGINQVWVGDVTYLRHQKRWWYLAVVMDVYSRKVVGWSLEKYRKKELTIEALQRALRNRRPKSEMIFHSDRGAEYAAGKYREVLEKHGIEPSMNRPGRCTDNAHMESFFHSIKGEWLRGNKYDTVEALRKSIKDYIVHFYNRTRLHSGLNYCSPNEFERL
ncbi:MAG: IS3 family transposase, partial [Gammaproteobacteria bacterium]|nr:IS3 family transposase [Gammaproteobacteria bacterium]